MFDAKKVTNEIVQWIKNYFEENGKSSKAVIGISGGKDSSVVASLCVEALGKDRVIGIMMPKGYQYDIDVSQDLCKYLNIQYYLIDIEKSVNQLYQSLEHEKIKLNDIVLNNTPARIRMSILYAVSACVGGRVANTSNLSEDWIGWATKFGDSAGDFSPLSNLTVTEVLAIGMELGLPLKFINKIPEDGLTGKSDEENFGFTYAVLDKYIRDGICEDEKIKAKIDKLHLCNLHKIKPMPGYEPKL